MVIHIGSSTYQYVPKYRDRYTLISNTNGSYISGQIGTNQNPRWNQKTPIPLNKHNIFGHNFYNYIDDRPPVVVASLLTAKCGASSRRNAYSRETER